jgi:hypothetical protein
LFGKNCPPSQYTLVTTAVTDAKAQAKLWGFGNPTILAKMEAAAVFSKQADLDASQLLDLFQHSAIACYI